MGLSLAGSSGDGLWLRALRWFGAFAPGHSRVRFSCTVRLSGGASAGSPGLFGVDAHTSPFRSEDTMPCPLAYMRVCALLGQVGRAGLPGALWCATTFLCPLLLLALLPWPTPGCSCLFLFVSSFCSLLCVFFLFCRLCPWLARGFFYLWSCVCPPRLFCFFSFVSLLPPCLFSFLSGPSFSMLWFLAPASCPAPSPPPPPRFFVVDFLAPSCFFRLLFLSSFLSPRKLHPLLFT